MLQLSSILCDSAVRTGHLAAAFRFSTYKRVIEINNSQCKWTQGRGEESMLTCSKRRRKFHAPSHSISLCRRPVTLNRSFQAHWPHVLVRSLWSLTIWCSLGSTAASSECTLREYLGVLLRISRASSEFNLDCYVMFPWCSWIHGDGMMMVMMITTCPFLLLGRQTQDSCEDRRRGCLAEKLNLGVG